jgi:hypothetical protein
MPKERGHLCDQESVSTQTWVHKVTKTRLTAGFRDIF